MTTTTAGLKGNKKDLEEVERLVGKIREAKAKRDEDSLTVFARCHDLEAIWHRLTFAPPLTTYLKKVAGISPIAYRLYARARVLLDLPSLQVIGLGAAIEIARIVDSRETAAKDAKAILVIVKPRIVEEKLALGCLPSAQFTNRAIAAAAKTVGIDADTHPRGARIAQILERAVEALVRIAAVCPDQTTRNIAITELRALRKMGVPMPADAPPMAEAA